MKRGIGIERSVLEPACASMCMIDPKKMVYQHKKIHSRKQIADVECYAMGSQTVQQIKCEAE